jgi:hypothetical protein
MTPSDSVPRSREEIAFEATPPISGLNGGEVALLIKLNCTLEVLLDCRDFLAEIAVGMSELRTNTETIAIWAERQPK